MSLSHTALYVPTSLGPDTTVFTVADIATAGVVFSIGGIDATIFTVADIAIAGVSFTALQVDSTTFTVADITTTGVSFTLSFRSPGPDGFFLF